jgi:4-hydroxybenzoate polyprenyltransferase/phosphoserine phosphatase
MGVISLNRLSDASSTDAGACRRLEGDIPLCVDLDGTLVRTDTLLEAAVALVKRNPAYALLVPLWLIRGRANLKAQIARRVTLDVARLPYNEELKEFLFKERQRGRQLILITASNIRIARRVADHLGIFSAVFGSDDVTNLSGRAKQRLLEQRFGRKGYDYAGNATVDLTIWSQANHAIVVNAPARLVRRAQRLAPTAQIGTRSLTYRTIARALRVHQWAKNVLILVPLITSHHVFNVDAVLASFYAFLSFGLAASTGYLINDILDLENDRQHPKKCRRPLAAGDMSLQTALVLIPLCLIGSLAVGTLLPSMFMEVLLIYLAGTLSYSLYLKQFVLVDVIILAALYALRIYAGAVAIQVTPSQWLLLFSMFVFMSLALMKRFAELRGATTTLGPQECPAGRGYFPADLEHIATVGTASGYIAVLVLALYINSHDVAALYKRPELLWLACPLLLYWISRVWLLAYRGRMNEDPVVFALKDSKSYMVGLMLAAIMLLAS